MSKFVLLARSCHAFYQLYTHKNTLSFQNAHTQIKTHTHTKRENEQKREREKKRKGNILYQKSVAASNLMKKNDVALFGKQNAALGDKATNLF